MNQLVIFPVAALLAYAGLRLVETVGRYVFRKLCKLIKGIKKPALGGLGYRILGMTLYTLLCFTGGATAAEFYDAYHASAGSSTAVTAHVAQNGQPTASIERAK